MGECLSGTCGLVGPDTLVQILLVFVVAVLDVGGWLTHGDVVLDTKVDFCGCG